MGPLFFRAENTSSKPSDPEPGRTASMGPLFFRAENGCPRLRLVASGWLQWGRSFSERRTPMILDCERHWGRFNGAALFQSGEPTTQLLSRATRRASMGPLFFRAENLDRGPRCRAITDASMGPLFFRAENGDERGQTKLWLKGFNGAALFQSGERVPRLRLSLLTPSFNGAALFQSGEPFCESSGPAGQCRLQWGRSFSERRTSLFRRTC